jgi:phage baseplate assembly protein V
MTSRAGYWQEAQVPDMERRLADVVRLGTVEAKDFSRPQAPRVRVRSGDVLTGWIPWTSGRAGGDSEWDPLDTGEQVVMVAPSGDLAQAVIVGSIHQQQFAAPDTGEDVRARRYKDGALDSYDRASHTRTITVPSGGAIRFSIGGTTWELTASGATLTTSKLTVNGDIDLKGTLTATEDVLAQGVSLVNHVNTGVTPGPANTGPPAK